jgi:hypothetical protein
VPDQSSLPVESTGLVPGVSDPQSLSRGKKVRDFLIGFFGALVLNVGGILLHKLSIGPNNLPGWVNSWFIEFESIAPWMFNLIIVILALVFKRWWITLGLVCLYVAGFLITLILALLAVG